MDLPTMEAREEHSFVFSPDIHSFNELLGDDYVSDGYFSRAPPAAANPAPQQQQQQQYLPAALQQQPEHQEGPPARAYPNPNLDFLHIVPYQFVANIAYTSSDNSPKIMLPQNWPAQPPPPPELRVIAFDETGKNVMVERFFSLPSSEEPNTNSKRKTINYDIPEFLVARLLATEHAYQLKFKVERSGRRNDPVPTHFIFYLPNNWQTALFAVQIQLLPRHSEWPGQKMNYVQLCHWLKDSKYAECVKELPPGTNAAFLYNLARNPNRTEKKEPLESLLLHLAKFDTAKEEKKKRRLSSGSKGVCMDMDIIWQLSDDEGEFDGGFVLTWRARISNNTIERLPLACSVPQHTPLCVLLEPRMFDVNLLHTRLFACYRDANRRWTKAAATQVPNGFEIQLAGITENIGRDWFVLVCNDEVGRSTYVVRIEVVNDTKAKENTPVESSV